MPEHDPACARVAKAASGILVCIRIQQGYDYGYNKAHIKATN